MIAYFIRHGNEMNYHCRSALANDKKQYCNKGL